jgi:hypothetical protein
MYVRIVTYRSSVRKVLNEVRELLSACLLITAGFTLEIVATDALSMQQHLINLLYQINHMI